MKKKETRIASWVLPSGSCTLYNTLQRPATPCNALQRPATPCNALQRPATHCNALQRTATHCNALQPNAETKRPCHCTLAYVYIHIYMQKQKYIQTYTIFTQIHILKSERKSEQETSSLARNTYLRIYIYVHVRIQFNITPYI